MLHWRAATLFVEAEKFQVTGDGWKIATADNLEGMAQGVLRQGPLGAQLGRAIRSRPPP